MRKVEWKMKEQFIFPEAIGTPTNTETLTVTPRFTVDKSTDNLKMTGIYHIAANIEFDAETSRGLATESAIMIDDVDVDGKLGYFEYAVPFNIDLPPEAKDPLDLSTLNVAYEVEEEGQLAIIWDVACTYKEVVVVPDQTVAEEAEREEANQEAIVHAENDEQVLEEQVEAERVDVVVENRTFSEGDEVLTFIAGLEDGITATQFRLNDILVQSKSESS